MIVAINGARESPLSEQHPSRRFGRASKYIEDLLSDLPAEQVAFRSYVVLVLLFLCACLLSP
jgi:hypothetical protein